MFQFEKLSKIKTIEEKSSSYCVPITQINMEQTKTWKTKIHLGISFIITYSITRNNPDFMKPNETSVQPAHQPTTTQVGYISCMY